MGNVLVASRVGGYVTAPVTPPTDPPPPPPAGPELSSTPWLPFDMPTAAALDATADTGPLIPVHAMATWRRVMTKDANLETDLTMYEHRYYLPPGGVENPNAVPPAVPTDHRPYGGFTRNRPLGRAPLGTGYTLLDKRWEIRQMQAAGIPHLTVDILGSGTWSHVLEWVQAAYLEGWRNRVVLMPDCGGSMARAGAASLAGYLKQVLTGPYAAACRKHSDGRWLIMPWAPETVLSSTKTAFTDQQLIDYWKAFSTAMVGQGTPAALWCCFNRAWRDASEHTATCFSSSQLADLVVGLGRWGTRNPVESASTSIDNAGAPAYCRSTYKKAYVYTVGVEDNRPDQSKFEECGGWENLLTWADVAMSAKPEAIQIATWNDWREGAAVAPSLMHGYSTLDVLAYYLVQIRMPGYRPPIVRDGLYLAHRLMNTPTATVQPTYGANSLTGTTLYTKRMAKVGSTAERNLVDLLVFATQPGQVSITIGGTAKTCTIPTQPGIAAPVTGTSVTVPAGVTRVQAPIGNGTVVATLKRAGVTVPGGTVSSARPIDLNNQLVQDMMYWRASSLR